MPLPWESIDAFLKAAGVRVGKPTLPQTTGGVHVPTSLHYLGRARDYGPNTGTDAAAAARALLPLAQGKAHKLAELFYSPLGIFYKNGNPIKPDAKLERSHRDHVHAGLRGGVVLTANQSAALGGLMALVGLGALVMFARSMSSRW